MSALLSPRSAAKLAPSPSIEEFPNLPAHRGPICVVTGSTSFIGRSLIALLLAKGFRVRGTIIPSEVAKNKELHDQFPALETYEANLMKNGSFIPAFHDAEYVFHCAFPLNQAVDHPQSQLVDPALNGTVNVIEAALSVETMKKIVMTSSCAAARRPDLPSHVITEKDWNDSATLENGAFAYSKVLAERKAWEMIEAHNLHNPDQSVTLITILPSWVIGPPFSALTEAVSLKAVRTWFEGGEGPAVGEVNVVDVRDVAKAHLAAIERPMIHGRYIVSLPDVTSPAEMVGILQKFYPNHKISAPPTQAGSSGVGKVDNSRAVRELGIQFTPLETTLQDTVERMIELGMIKGE